MNYPNGPDTSANVEQELRDQVTALQREIEELRITVKRTVVNPLRGREDYSSHLDVPAIYANQFSCQMVRGMFRIMVEETFDYDSVARRFAFVTDVNAAAALVDLLKGQVEAVVAASSLAAAPVPAQSVN